MAIRMGEMMVVVRAQDFASRTLHKVGAELGMLSKAQQLQRAQTMLNIRADKATAQTGQLIRAQSYLKVLRNQIILETRLSRIRKGMPAQVVFGPGGAKAMPAQPPRFITGQFASTREVAALEAGLLRANAQIERMPAEFRRLGQSSASLAAREADIAARTRQVADGFRRLRPELAMIAEDQMVINTAMRQLPVQRLQDFGHALGGVGRTMQLFGAIGTAIFAVTANAFAKFNQQITLAATQTRKAGESFEMTGKNADRLTDIVLKQMGKFPASAEDMSAAAYDIFSSIDVAFGGGVKLLRMFNKVAVAGGVDLKTATAAGISVLENFDQTLVRTGKVTDTTTGILNRMFAIVRFGRMNFAQFNNMLTSVVPAATGAQQSFDDVSGAMAFLTRRIPSQQRAATALARLLDVFTSRDFQEGMRKAGLAITDTSGHLIALPDIIDRISALKPNRLNEIIRALTAFGRGQGRGREYTVQARRALTQLISGVNEYRRVQKSVVRDNDEFNKSFQAMSRTLGVEWQVFMNQLKVLVLYIGRSALPVFLDIAEFVSKWADKWKGLSASTRSAIVRWGVIISVGTLLTGVLFAIAGSIVSLAASFIGVAKTFGDSAKGLGTALKTFEGLARAYSRLAAIGTIVIGIELIRKGGNWERIGWVLSAAGLGFAGRGARGAVVAGSIAIGVQLAMQGSGWQSIIGQILAASAAGGAFRGVPGAIFAGSVATITIALRQAESDRAKLEKLMDFEQRLKDFRMIMSIQTDEKQTDRVFREMFSKARRIFAEQGQDAAITFGENFMDKALRDLRPLTRRFQDVHDRLRAAVPDVNEKLTLRESVLKGARNFTEILAAANQQTQEIGRNIDRIAISISQAVLKGNLFRATQILNQFVANANEKLTGENVLQKINEAVLSGDIQGAGSLIEAWSNQVQQSMDDAARRAESLAKTVTDATKTATENLRQLFSTLRDENERLFGELAQGPWLTSETFDLAKEWGIAPGIQDLTRDLREQREVFTTLQKNLVKIAKRGAPKELIDQLKQLGPDAMPLIEQIAKAKPGQFQKLVAEFKKGQKIIDQATKVDFKNTIDQWRRSGKDMGQAILDGFQEAGVGAWFDGWVKTTFPGLIGSAVAAAVAEFNKTNPAVTIMALPQVPAPARRGRGIMQMGQVDPSIFTNKRFLDLIGWGGGRGGRKRALGGSVTRGMSYLVGERGPERFTPNRSGRILSNRATQNSSVDNSRSFTFNYTAGRGSEGATEYEEQRRAAFLAKTTFGHWW